MVTQQDQPLQKKTFSWIHLSDWHEGKLDTDRAVLLEKLLEDISNRGHIDPRLMDLDAIIFSGDAAFSGQPAEYEAVRTTLIEPLQRIIGPVRLFIAPGNHDFDRNKLSDMPKEWEDLFSLESLECQKKTSRTN